MANDNLTPKEKVEVVVYGLGLLRTLHDMYRKWRVKRNAKRQQKKNESTN